MLNFVWVWVFAQLSGIINQYSKVLGFPAADQVQVQTPAPFNPGDRILIYQAQGAQITTLNNSTYGDIQSIGGAGLFEFASIQSISGDVLTLDCALTRSFGDPVTGAIQVVRVSYHTGNVSVDGPVSAQPWDGNKGGIVVIETEGVLTLNADIVVSGQGFRGGVRSLNQTTNTCFTGDPNLYTDTTWYGPQTMYAGNKGEGVAAPPSNSHIAHRGKIASGGGGGNMHNCGGGGGGSIGAGGDGGWTTCACVGNSYPNLLLSPVGKGGASLGAYLNASAPRLFLGGGGGGGQQNNNEGGNGGNGGGIIIIRAAQIVGNNRVLRADGQTVVQSLGSNCAFANATSSGNDGAGGGGGGGSIAIYCSSFSGALHLSAQGAPGQHASWQTCPCLNTPDHGPGGGGGGGLIALSNSNLPPLVSVSVTGGPNGQERSPRNENVNGCNNTGNSNCIPSGPARFSRGATAGADGSVLYDLSWTAVSPCPLSDISLRTWKTHVCPTGHVHHKWEITSSVPVVEVHIAWSALKNPSLSGEATFSGSSSGSGEHILPESGTYEVRLLAILPGGRRHLLSQRTLEWHTPFILKGRQLTLFANSEGYCNIYDARGQLLLQASLFPMQPLFWDLSAWPAGPYLLQTHEGTFRFVLAE